MSKRCPNCGYKESDDSNICHICGATLVDDNSSQDFEYDFGAQPVGNQSANFSFNDDNNANPFEVKMSLTPVQAVKCKKNLTSWSSFLIVICIIRFVIAFISIQDIQAMQDMISGVEWDMLLEPINGYTTVFYFDLAVLALFLVASIVLMMFAQKVNRCQIPPQDNSLFERSKKALFASIAILVVVVAYVVLEVCLIVYDAAICEMINTSPALAQNAGSLVVDALMIFGAITCLLSSLRLSKSRQN